jgi:hypothetical protein
MRMIVKQLVEWRLAGETEVLGENLPQRHFVHHKSPLTRPGLDARAAAVGSQRLTAWAMARPNQLTNSTELSPPWEANSRLATQEFPTYYGNRRFTDVYAVSCLWSLFWARRIQILTFSSLHLHLLPALRMSGDTHHQPQQTNSVALVRKRTIPTERPLLVGEVNANFSR